MKEIFYSLAYRLIRGDSQKIAKRHALRAKRVDLRTGADIRVHRDSTHIGVDELQKETGWQNVTDKVVDRRRKIVRG